MIIIISSGSRRNTPRHCFLLNRITRTTGLCQERGGEGGGAGVVQFHANRPHSVTNNSRM